METQTMGSNGSGGTQDGFSKQAPFYKLTLDEVEHQLGDLGKPLSGMNLDELLKSVWTAETEEAYQGMSGGSGPLDYSQHTQLGSVSYMARQSSLGLSRDLSKMTVDELWQDIQQDQKKKDTSGSNGGHNLDRKISREKQPVLGEMTLEDFLVKAGIVSKSSHENQDPASVIGADSIKSQWMQYQIPPIQQPQHVFMAGHHQVQQPVMDAAYPETQMTMSPSPLMDTLSDTQTPGRKRVASGDVMGKTVERRQKRMIKNRESAARSRARKQAYTHELENKVSRLEEENERLKLQNEAEKVLPCVPPPEPKYQLRRTSSALF